jgi:hypothetical protein
MLLPAMFNNGIMCKKETFETTALIGSASQHAACHVILWPNGGGFTKVVKSGVVHGLGFES